MANEISLDKIALEHKIKVELTAFEWGLLINAFDSEYTIVKRAADKILDQLNKSEVYSPK